MSAPRAAVRVASTRRGCIDLEHPARDPLGVILYELLAGKAPFDAPQSGTLLAMHIFKEPPNLCGIEPQVPENVASLVHQMLAKAPAERPDAAAVAAELAHLEEGLQVVPPPARKFRLAYVAAGLLAALAAVLGIWLAARRPSPVTPTPMPAERKNPPPPAVVTPAAPPLPAKPAADAPPVTPPIPALTPQPSAALSAPPVPPSAPTAAPPGKLPHPRAGGVVRAKSVSGKPPAAKKPGAKPAGGKIEVEIVN